MKKFQEYKKVSPLKNMIRRKMKIKLNDVTDFKVPLPSRNTLCLLREYELHEK